MSVSASITVLRDPAIDRAIRIDRRDNHRLHLIGALGRDHAMPESDTGTRREPSFSTQPRPRASNFGRFIIAGAADNQSDGPDKSQTAAISPSAAATLPATAASNGPQPAITTRRPGSMPCDLIIIVAAARPITRRATSSRERARHARTRRSPRSVAVRCTPSGPSGPVASTRKPVETDHDAPARLVRDARCLAKRGAADRRRRGCRHPRSFSSAMKPAAALTAIHLPTRSRSLRRAASRSCLVTAAAIAALAPAGPAPSHDQIRVHCGLVPASGPTNSTVMPSTTVARQACRNRPSIAHEALLAHAHQAERTTRACRTRALPQTDDAASHQARLPASRRCAPSPPPRSRLWSLSRRAAAPACEVPLVQALIASSPPVCGFTSKPLLYTLEIVSNCGTARPFVRRRSLGEICK